MDNEYTERETKMLERMRQIESQLAQAVYLLETARSELYNSGMSPALLAKITEFLWPTDCKD